MRKLRLGGKSDLLACLENLSAAKSEAPAVTDITLDAPAIVQMLKPGVSKTFEVYAKEVFLPYLLLQLRKATRVDIVWDVYRTDSLKGTARLKRGHGHNNPQPDVGFAEADLRSASLLPRYPT